MKRGHSNARVEETRPFTTNPQRACIPIAGGANVWSVKALPPLSLSRAEWEEIGRRMGWIKAKSKARA